MARRRAPVAWAASCQGTMLEWCSISVITISSPGRRNLRPQAAATRLIASVVLRVNTISEGWRALIKAATLARTSS